MTGQKWLVQGVWSKVAPASPFCNNEWCLRERQALVVPKPSQGVLVRGHAGLEINNLSPDGSYGLGFRVEGER